MVSIPCQYFTVEELNRIEARSGHVCSAYVPPPKSDSLSIGSDELSAKMADEHKKKPMETTSYIFPGH